MSARAIAGPCVHSMDLEHADHGPQGTAGVQINDRARGSVGKRRRTSAVFFPESRRRANCGFTDSSTAVMRRCSMECGDSSLRAVPVMAVARGFHHVACSRRDGRAPKCLSFAHLASAQRVTYTEYSVHSSCACTNRRTVPFSPSSHSSSISVGRLKVPSESSHMVAVPM